MDRNSFIMYVDSLRVLHDLTNEQAGMLFKTIAAFQEEDKETLHELLSDFTTRVIFRQFETYFERDASKYSNIVEKRREAGKRGGAPKGNTNASRNKQNQAKQAKQPDSDSVSDSDSIKEKISKKKDISFSDRNQLFTDSLVPYVELYGKGMIRAFYDYWSEPNKANTKMRYELEKTWSLEARLRTWERRSHNGK